MKIVKLVCLAVILITLLGWVVFYCLADETTNLDKKTEQDPYEKYAKSIYAVITELEKVDFALETNADVKIVTEKLLNDIKQMQEKQSLILESDFYKLVDKPLVSYALFTQGSVYYGNLLTAYKARGAIQSSELMSFLSSTAQAFIKATKIALDKNEKITIADCPLCKNTRYYNPWMINLSLIPCYYCESQGLCPNCRNSKEKGCQICGRTGLCPVCLGKRMIPCPICNVINSKILTGVELTKEFKGFRRKAQLLKCQSNLRALYMGLIEYESQFKEYPHGANFRGSAFWNVLRTLPSAKTSIFQDKKDDLFVCPIKGDKPSPDICNYLGPNYDVSDKLEESDPIGADFPDNHDDGTVNVLYWGGTVAEVKINSPEWERIKDKLVGEIKK